MSDETYPRIYELAADPRRGVEIGSGCCLQLSHKTSPSIHPVAAVSERHQEISQIQFASPLSRKEKDE